MMSVLTHFLIFKAECPEVGTVDQGETIGQAIAGWKEATRLYLEEFFLPDTINFSQENLQIWY